MLLDHLVGDELKAVKFCFGYLGFDDGSLIAVPLLVKFKDGSSGDGTGSKYPGRHSVGVRIDVDQFCVSTPSELPDHS